MPKASTICIECRSITIPCKCGCGGEAHLYGYDGKQRQGYLLYHHSRTDEHKATFAKNRPPKPFEGRRHSSAARAKISCNKWPPKPHEGKRHSPKTKAKMSRDRRGSGNSNWKGGLTMQIRGIRRSPEYYQWRKAVLSQDKYACCLCGSADNLHAHHKLPIAEYPNKIFVVSNGITLCRKCHEKTHLLLLKED